MLVHMFPGQGSQFRGMGEGLFGRFGEIVARADAVLGYPVARLCLEDPSSHLNMTTYTQPAIFVVSVLDHLRACEDAGAEPDVLIGHSVGEYAALCAAGAFDFETGLRLVQKRAELMGTVTGGGMAAVLGLEADAVRSILETVPDSEVDIANLNTPLQTVIAGPRGSIDAIGSIFELEGATFVPLNVSGAFHSRHMARVRDEFVGFMEGLDITAPRLTVVANVDARPYDADVTSRLADQLTSPVRWVGTIAYVDALGGVEYAEMGPGTVLARMLEKIREQSPSASIAAAALPEPDAHAEAAAPSGVFDAAMAQPLWDAEERAEHDAAPSASLLGSATFRAEYDLRHAYVAGSMMRGVSSPALVSAMTRAGCLAFLGSAGMSLTAVEDGIRNIAAQADGRVFGIDLVPSTADSDAEERLVDLALAHGIRVIEASAYLEVTPALVRYRAAGLDRGPDGAVTTSTRIMAKVSRPEVAEVFLEPAPAALVERLRVAGVLTAEQCALLAEVPMANHITVEADSAGNTDGGSPYALLPAVIALRDAAMAHHAYTQRIDVGAAGGIGTPAAIAAAFTLGADYVMTGSVNQCTVEAGWSEPVKDMLAAADINDTEHVPAGNLFEMGAICQVLKKGTLFPARARKLHDLYRFVGSLDALDAATKEQIEQSYFGRTFPDIYAELVHQLPDAEVQRAERSPRAKMAFIFKWYFGHTSDLALEGAPGREAEYQIPCGPSLGAFNRWVAGTPLADWRNRHVADIAERLMQAAADHLAAQRCVDAGEPTGAVL